MINNNLIYIINDYLKIKSDSSIIIDDDRNLLLYLLNQKKYIFD